MECVVTGYVDINTGREETGASTSTDLYPTQIYILSDFY